MKKVLHLIYSDIYSGAETVAVNIIKNLPSGWEGCYVAPDGDGIKQVAAMGINTVTCDTHSVSAVKKLISEIKPDAVHAHDPHMSMIAALAGARFVSHLHCNCPWMASVCPNSLGLAYSCMKASRVFCVSPSIKEEYVFRTLLKEKGEVLYNFVDADSVKRLAGEPVPERYDLCFTGRMTDIKKPWRFVDLVSELKKEKEDIKAVMVGDGDEREKTELYAKELGVSDNIFFAGYDPNPYKYMNNSKIGVLTSSSEGFGLVAVEAMILGLPFLAFPTGGLTRIISDENGKLCRDTDEMKDEVLRLLTDEDRYRRKSEMAKESSRRFTDIRAYMDSVVAAYEKGKN